MEKVKTKCRRVYLIIKMCKLTQLYCHANGMRMRECLVWKTEQIALQLSMYAKLCANGKTEAFTWLVNVLVRLVSMALNTLPQLINVECVHSV